MITTGLCYSYKREVLEGIHEAVDDYRIALFRATADLGPTTTVYSGQAGEVATAGGYVAGGKVLTGFTIGETGGTAWLDFDDVVWPNATIKADGAMIYNATKGNRAVCVIAFDAEASSTNDAFRLQFPAPGAGSGFITIT